MAFKGDKLRFVCLITEGEFPSASMGQREEPRTFGQICFKSPCFCHRVAPMDCTNRSSSSIVDSMK